MLAGGITAAAAAGVALLAVAPTHYATQYEFRTVSAFRELLPTDPVTVGTTYINSICGVVDGVATEHRSSQLDCRNPQLAEQWSPTNGGVVEHSSAHLKQHEKSPKLAAGRRADFPGLPDLRGQTAKCLVRPSGRRGQTSPAPVTW